jgi:hypothetical protein
MKIQENREAGIGPKQNNSIDPRRTDEKAIRMREKGERFLQKKGGC